MTRNYLYAVVCVAAFCAAASAQTTTATLLGLIRDKSGASVTGVQITAENVATAFTRTTVSDETGAYLITNLPVGDYVITAEKSGFTRFAEKGITLVVAQNARVDITLSL